MKTSLSILAFLVLSLASLSAKDTRYFSYIIKGTDDPVQIAVQAGLYMKIVNFSQQQTQSNTVGDISVTKYGNTASILTSSRNGSAPDPVFIAGPCTVTISPLPGDTLFVTFLLGWN